MIRVTRKRLVVTTVVLLVLAGILVVTWKVCDWPPLRLILKYGLQTTTVDAKVAYWHPSGLTFVRLPAGYGYCRSGVLWPADRGSLVARWARRLGLAERRVIDAKRRHDAPKWVEIPREVWISTTVVNQRVLLELQRLADREFSGGARHNMYMFRNREEILDVVRAVAPGEYRPPTSDEWRLAVEIGAISLRGALSETLLLSDPTTPGMYAEQRRVYSVEANVNGASQEPVQSFRLVLLDLPSGVHTERSED